MTLVVKLRRDVRASWSRFVLMVLAIAISLTVFGGVLCAWAAIGRETSRAYLSTEPASATLVLEEPVPVSRMKALADEATARPGVVEAAGRTQFTGQVGDMPLQVFIAAPDDPMRVAKFKVPPPGELYLTKDSLDLLGVSVGDSIAITTAQGHQLQVRVTGTVYDPSLAPAPQEQTGHGYLSAASVRRGLDQLKIRTTPSRDRDAVVAVAEEVGRWLRDDRGLAVREIQVPEPNAHPHQWQSDALLLSLLGGAAAALVLSAVLVATMLNGLFTQQIPQIGIMKAIGAPSRRIARFYLAMTLSVAAVATALAFGPAVLIGRAGLERFLGFLGIEGESLAAPWWTYLVILAVGLGVPPLMALPPLIRASRTTVRAAIDHRGASSSGFGARVLARFSRIDRGLLMALRNTVRRPARFLLSVGLLASAGMVFVAGMSLGSGVKAIDEERKAARTWDVDVQLAEPAPADSVTAAASRAPGISRVEGWSRTQTGVAGPGQIPVTRTYPDQGHGRITITAFPAETRTLHVPKLLEGRWLEPGETGAVVLNQVTRRNAVPGARAGDTVQLFIGGKPTTWRVAGIVEEREGGVYATAEGVAAATGQPPRVNQLRIVTGGHDEQTRQTVANAVEKALTDAGFEVQSAASVSRSDAISSGHLGPVILILLAVAIPLGLIGGIGLASTMSANVLDRTREFGVMHAIGARPRTVHRIVVAEGIILAVVSCLVAVVPALLLTKVLGMGLGSLFMSAPLPYRISLLAVVIWVALAVLGAALATEAAATRASRLTVREALAYL